tara:strand:+ start:128 stop:574 length:447 start_codon:yes stop_codon:yes gene_type:complete
VKKYLILGAILLIVDQITKYWVRINSVYHDLGIVAINYVKNTGASFGLFQGFNYILVLLYPVALFAMYYYRRELLGSKWKNIFYTLIIAGILGNFIDRIFFGFVIDFIDLKWWPVFNLADSYLCIGIVGTIYLNLRTQNSSNSDSLSK